VLPSRLNDEAENWILQAHGDTVDGERLEFRPILGDQTAVPPPDADFRIQFGSDDSAEPIVALTPIHVDATLSRGSGLTYFIEFGDGFVATGAQATHVADAAIWPPVTARLTVVDRLGRSDSESVDYSPFGLGNFRDDGWFFNDGQGSYLSFRFVVRTGTNYLGAVLFGQTDVRGMARATLSGEHDVRIVLPDVGIEFHGTVVVSGLALARMTLVQVGGRDSGRTRVLQYNGGQ
jgi:hypothetical protein